MSSDPNAPGGQQSWGQPQNNGQQSWGQPQAGGQPAWGQQPQASGGGQAWGQQPQAAAGNWGGGGGNAGAGMGGQGTTGNTGGSWSPPPGAPPPKKGGCGKVLLIMGLLGVLGVGALVALAMLLPKSGQGELLAVTVIEDHRGAVAQIRYVLDAAPEEPDDLQNLVLRINSYSAFTGEQTFDWEFLSKADDRPETNPGQDPPVGIEMYLEIPIETYLMSNITVGSEGVWLDVELEWDGDDVDSWSEDIESLYDYY